MKKLVLLMAAVCLSGILQAQYYYLPYTNNPGGNPGGLNNDAEYPVGGGLTTGWTTVRASSATPAWSNSTALPFAFSFNGSPVTNYKVSTTGILTFDVGTAMAPPAASAQSLPSALVPNNSICVWGLVGTGANDNVVVKTFGTAPNRQYWIFFSSYSIPTNANGWTYWSIVLEETTNNIYLVDQRTNGVLNMSLGVQINSTTAYQVTGSPNINTLNNNDPLPIDNNYYMFIQGTQSALDLSTLEITTSAYVNLGSNTIEGTIINFGSSTINSLTLNYTINGGAPVTDAVTGLNIPPLGTYNFSHATPWNSAATGAYTVEAYASNLNGSSDQNTSNDIASKEISVLTQIVQRQPLFEIFTSSTCPPCQPGNLNFHSIIDTINPDQHVYIKWQQDFPGTGDPYVTQESLNRRGYYSINSIPRQEIDGGWDGNANAFTYGLYQDARAVAAQYIIDGTYTEDTTARTYSAKVRYSPLFNAVGSVLHVAIVENLTTLNVKTNGETEFYQVMKKMVPDDNGTMLTTIAAGAWDSVSVTYTFNGNYRLPVNGQAANMIDHTVEHSVEQFGDLKLLGWIESSSFPFQVYQAQNLVKLSSTGIFEMSPNIESINIYPSPATEITTVEFNMTNSEMIRVQLMDMTGRVVEMKKMEVPVGMSTVTFDVSNIAAGTYHVAITDSKNNSFVRRIVVQ